jgi:methylase of polypeptide subunit release factors
MAGSRGPAVLHPLFGRLARSPRLARALLRLELPPLEPGEHYLDATTLGLLRAARGHVAPGSRVLDVGTGSAAVLALWLWRQLGCEVTATELAPHVAARARESVRLNRSPVRVVEGDLLAGLGGPFDHVLCNPPYVPTAAGRARGLPERLRSQWDGGADGTEVLARFLESFEREAGNATALLGVNRLHVPRELALQRIGERAGLELVERLDAAWLPSDVYVLARRPHGDAGAPDPGA